MRKKLTIGLVLAWALCAAGFALSAKWHQAFVETGTGDFVVNVTPDAQRAAGDTLAAISATGDSLGLNGGVRGFYVHAISDTVTMSGWYKEKKVFPEAGGDTAYTIVAGTDWQEGGFPKYDRLYFTRFGGTAVNVGVIE